MSKEYVVSRISQFVDEIIHNNCTPKHEKIDNIPFISR
jgi:hypothetical protein